jgi:hypothetical protein
MEHKKGKIRHTDKKIQLIVQWTNASVIVGRIKNGCAQLAVTFKSKP